MAESGQCPTDEGEEVGPALDDFVVVGCAVVGVDVGCREVEGDGDGAGAAPSEPPPRKNSSHSVNSTNSTTSSTASRRRQ
jgi:hypothetical protein